MTKHLEDLVKNQISRTIYASHEAGTFDIYSDRWVLLPNQPSGQKIPDLSELPPVQKEAILRSLAIRATKLQAATIEGDIYALKKFLKQAEEFEYFYDDGIDVEALLIYFDTGNNANRYVSETKNKIKILIEQAFELGYSEAFEEGVLSVCQHFNGECM